MLDISSKLVRSKPGNEHFSFTLAEGESISIGWHEDGIYVQIGDSNWATPKIVSKSRKKVGRILGWKSESLPAIVKMSEVPKLEEIEEVYLSTNYAGDWIDLVFRTNHARFTARFWDNFGLPKYWDYHFPHLLVPLCPMAESVLQSIFNSFEENNKDDYNYEDEGYEEDLESEAEITT